MVGDVSFCIKSAFLRFIVCARRHACISVQLPCEHADCGQGDQARHTWLNLATLARYQYRRTEHISAQSSSLSSELVWPLPLDDIEAVLIQDLSFQTGIGQFCFKLVASSHRPDSSRGTSEDQVAFLKSYQPISP